MLMNLASSSATIIAWICLAVFLTKGGGFCVVH